MKKIMRYQLILTLAISIVFSSNCTAQKKVGDDVKLTKTYGKISQTINFGKARAAHTATRLADGNVLIVGGMQKDGVLYDDAELFDSSKNSFSNVKSKLTKKRVSHTATLLKDGRVLIVGGWSNRSQPENTAEIFEPKTQKFVHVGNTKFARSGHSSTLLENGKVLIAGGYDGERNLSEAELFNPATNKFEPVGKMQSVRNVHSATVLKDGGILLTGGEIRRGEIASDAEIFDPKTNQFTKISAKMNAIRYKHDTVLLADGNVLIFGGSDERDFRGKLKSAEIFDTKKQIFTPINDMNFARFKINETAVLLTNNKVLIAGGNEEAEIFNPATNSFEKISGSLGKSLHYSSVTLLKDGRAIIVGGYEFVKSGEPTSTDQAWIFKI